MLIEKVEKFTIYWLDIKDIVGRFMKKLWNEQKRLKTAEKKVSTSFWVCPAPKAGRNTQQIVEVGFYFNLEF